MNRPPMVNDPHDTSASAYVADPDGHGIGVASVARDRRGRPHILIQIADGETRASLSVRPDPDQAQAFARAILSAVNQCMVRWSQWRIKEGQDE